MLPGKVKTHKRKNEKLLLASGDPATQNAGRMKKYIGTHLSAEDYRELGFMAAAQGTSKAAIIRKLVQQAILMAKKLKGKEAA